MHLVPHGRPKPLLEARDVSVRRCGHSLLQRVSITADCGELLALLGDAGSGTGTLLDILGGQVQPDAGQVLRNGRVPLELVSDPTGVRELAAVHGAAAARHRLVDGAPHGVPMLFHEPTKGLDDASARDVLAECRRAADDGHAVVVTLDRADLAATYATTVALVVAGRLLSWGSPAVALVPAFQLLSAGARRSG
ncbi:MAG: ATP-binding cassette domain-containing protein [Acidimicrobiia bacterium]